MEPVSHYYVMGNWLVELSAVRIYLGLLAPGKKLSPKKALLSVSVSRVVLPHYWVKFWALDPAFFFLWHGFMVTYMFKTHIFIGSMLFCFLLLDTVLNKKLKHLREKLLQV